MREEVIATFEPASTTTYYVEVEGKQSWAWVADTFDKREAMDLGQYYADKTGRRARVRAVGKHTIAPEAIAELLERASKTVPVEVKEVKRPTDTNEAHTRQEDLG